MKESNFILVTGGQRSGKSVFSEKMALQLTHKPVYIATAEAGDSEMEARIKRHRQRRGSDWTTFEQPLTIGNVPLNHGDVVVMDCVTLWATNTLFHFDENIDESLDFMKNELRKLSSKGATVIFVTNEVGWGGISGNPLVRKYTDLLGFINQYLASCSKEVYLMVSGIPMKIKS